MRGTVAAIEGNLMRDGFVARYDCKEEIDGLPPGEGVFLPCTFWLADNLALLGRQADATTIFERLLEVRNDVGLVSEEYDPSQRRLAGQLSAGVHSCLVDQYSDEPLTGHRARQRPQRQLK